MNQEAYESFVARIEAESERQPALYKIRLGGMAVLGYAYVAGILLLLSAVLAAFGWMVIQRSGAVLAIKLSIFVIPLIWAVLRAMFVRLSPPMGREITEREAPDLFKLVEEVRRRARAPKANKVLVTEDFNAAVVQHPRLGIFGWPQNYLVLGLPLMQALSVDEFRAVVAHEFGHLSGAHGKFGAWIYRLRAGWARLAYALDQSDHWGKFLFVPFFNWYAPTFGAYSFVQARRQEYEADRVSAVAAGANVAGEALVRVELQAQFLQGEYWKNVFREADTKPQPDTHPFSGMRLAFTGQGSATAASSTLAAALKRRTGFDDTHPCLGDRLRALGIAAALPAPLTRSAAEVLLGPFGHSLASEFDKRWHENVTQWWQGRHKYVAESRARLAELDTAAAAGELSVDDAFQRAMLTEELVDESSAEQQLEALAPRAQQHAATQFALGRLKLARDDDSGLALLQTASRLDHDAALAAGPLIVDYLKRHGRNEEARPHIDNLTAAGELEVLARKERSQLLASDKLLPHDLARDKLQTLAEQLARHPDVAVAYLARKQTRYYPDVPMYVLAVQRRTRWWKIESASAAQKLVDVLCQELTSPGETLIVCIDGQNKSFRARFRKVDGALIHSKPE
jgi:Zn-dependent protease with chaperone function